MTHETYKTAMFDEFRDWACEIITRHEEDENIDTASEAFELVKSLANEPEEEPEEPEEEPSSTAQENARRARDLLRCSEEDNYLDSGEALALLRAVATQSTND